MNINACVKAVLYFFKQKYEHKSRFGWQKELYYSVFQQEYFLLYVLSVAPQHSEVADHANIIYCQEEMQQNNLSRRFKFNLKRLSHYFSNRRATVFVGHEGYASLVLFSFISRKKVEIVNLFMIVNY